MLSHEDISELDGAIAADAHGFVTFWTYMWRYAEHGVKWWPEQMRHVYPEEVDVYTGMPLDSIVALVKMGRPTGND